MTDVKSFDLSASLEDYLEAIFRLVQVKRVARAKDIGKRLQVSRSSVTGALHALAKRELINYEPYDLITLTARGQEAAEQVAGRHEALYGFFVRVLGVGEQEADAAACKMEHSIPEVILERFVEFVEFVDRCPRGGAKWLDGAGFFCGSCGSDNHCRPALEPGDAAGVAGESS